MAGPTKDWKPGPGKLYYGTDLTELGLLEQDPDLNKELESGRAGKNQCDSEGVVHPLRETKRWKKNLQWSLSQL